MPLSAEHRAEIDELRKQERPTRRAVAPALEEILYSPLPVLDHGFVRVIDYMGDDAAIVQAARVSYGRGTKQVSSDRGLINYLMRHRHTSPFEMCEIKVHVKLPIFVARQWIRHRTASVNEYSARYSILDKEFYVPDRDYLKIQDTERKRESRQANLFEHGDSAKPQFLGTQSAQNKQGRENKISPEEAGDIVRIIKTESARAYTNYTKLLNEDYEGNVIDSDKQGIARELARMVLPLNIYTQWYWKVDLHNLLHFLGLRADPHAQYEIRAYAEVLLDVVRRWVPLTCEAFENHVLGGVRLSAAALAVVRRMLAGESESMTREASGLSPREWRELREVLGLPPG